MLKRSFSFYYYLIYSNKLILLLIIILTSLSNIYGIQTYANQKKVEKESNTEIKDSEKISDSNKINPNAGIEWKPIKKNNQVKEINIKWEKINPKQNNKELIKWVPANEVDLENINYQKVDISTNLRKLYEKDLNFKLMNLGKAVPTADTLNEGDMRFSISQVSPINSGYAKGTGNQNYLGEIEYGVKNNLLFSIFYTDADDPLHKRISGLDTQPENRWSNYGTALKWNFHESKNIKYSIEGSIENWIIQSGGCAGSNCSYNSNNIFNSGLDMVENNNLIGSLSFPITWSNLSNLDLTLTPRLIFLPKSQGNSLGKGEFYGNNYGIGLGISYQPINKLKAFASYYAPVASSKNYFDENLIFSSSGIYTTGVNYSLDTRINLESYITNGFGLTPSTSVLTIPSADETIYGLKITYRPYKLDIIDNPENTSLLRDHNGGGLSVSTNNLVNSEERRIKFFVDKNGTYLTRLDIGLSQLFSIDIATGKINDNVKTNSSYKTYVNPGKNILRAGATAIIFSEKRGDALSSAGRVSIGRVMGETKPGHVFGEIMNTKEIFNGVNLNINPKIASTGSGSLSSIGSSLNIEVSPILELIPETNFGINEAEDNWTLSLRVKPTENKHLDLYTTNSLSFLDIGQMMKNKSQVLGLGLTLYY